VGGREGIGDEEGGGGAGRANRVQDSICGDQRGSGEKIRKMRRRVKVRRGRSVLERFLSSTRPKSSERAGGGKKESRCC